MSLLRLFNFSEKQTHAELIRKLNEYVSHVYDKFNGKIKIESNIDSQVINVSFAGPVDELSVQTKYKLPPLGVLLIRLINSDTGNPESVSWTWVYSKDGKIRSPSFSTLSSAKYEARILVLGG